MILMMMMVVVFMTIVSDGIYDGADDDCNDEDGHDE